MQKAPPGRPAGSENCHLALSRAARSHVNISVESMSICNDIDKCVTSVRVRWLSVLTLRNTQ
eukprot:scaffold449482_cov14-Prasinocladus_malaysianus.AAC.1